MQQKPQKQHRQLMVSKCSARECRDPARHHVKRRWLLKIKTALQNQVSICDRVSKNAHINVILNGIYRLYLQMKNIITGRHRLGVVSAHHDVVLR